MEQDLKKHRVLVTPTTFGPYDRRPCQELEAGAGGVICSRRGRPLTSGELKELLPGGDGFTAGLERVDRAALESAGRLAVIARYGVGCESLRDCGAALRGETPLHPVLARGAQA